MEHIHCRIEYICKDNPKVKILIDNKETHSFVGNKGNTEFTFSIDKKDFIFTIEHFGKNMKKDLEKFIEIKKIYFNDIDIKNMIWETTQIAELPKWQKSKDFKWKSNLYLGHNAKIEYKLQSPIIEFLLNYHQPIIKTSHGMASNNVNFLNEMKEYFEDKVKEQKKNV